MQKCTRAQSELVPAAGLGSGSQTAEVDIMLVHNASMAQYGVGDGGKVSNNYLQTWN